MNELTAAQERYIDFVKELVSEGLNRVERMLGIDQVEVKAEPVAQLAPVIPAPAPALVAPATKTRRPYKKRSKAIAGKEIGIQRRGRRSAPTTGVRQLEAQSEKPASPPISSLKPKVLMSIGLMPQTPAVAAMSECPCVNPSKEECSRTAPSGIHTRGTGAAAQFSRCRFYDVRMAVEKQRPGGFNGPGLGRGRRSCPGCGEPMGGPYTHCKNCRAAEKKTA